MESIRPSWKSSPFVRLPGDSPQEARKVFISELADALSMLGDIGYLHIGASCPLEQIQSVDFEPVVCESNTYPAGLEAHCSYEFAVIENKRNPADGYYRCTTKKYILTIFDPSTSQRLIAFHWHPLDSGDSGSHMHIGKNVMPQANTLHIQTPRTTIEQFVGYCVDAFGAKPTDNDWRELLHLTESQHVEFRSWGNRNESKTAIAKP